METRICCAFNVSKGCELSPKVTVADCAGDPFKLMKLLLDGLAKKADASFWLTHISHNPQIVRIFPLDFAYLDKDDKVVQGVALPPGVPLPRFNPVAASALILPFNSLASSGTLEGDQIIICPQEELERRFAEMPNEPASQVAMNATGPLSSFEVSPPRPATSEPIPIASPRMVPPPMHTPIAQGTGYTVSLASRWQVSNSTTAAVVLEPAEGHETAAVIEAHPGPKSASAESTRLEERKDHIEFTDLEELEAVFETAGAEELPLVAPSESEPATAAEVALTISQRLAPARDDAGSEGAGSFEARDKIANLVVVDPDISFEAAPTTTSEEAIAARIARSKEAAEKNYVRTASVARTESAKPRKRPRVKTEEKKDHIGTRVIRWLNLDDPPPERRKIIRLLLQGLEAYQANGDHTKHYDVRDICPIGFCLRCQEKWQPGRMLSLIFERKGAPEKNREQRARVQARVVRYSEDGVGLEFAFPEGTDFQPRKRVKTKRSDETEADYILRELRRASALGFLRRLCPSASEEIRHAMDERLSNKRVASAVDIALQAEEALSRSRKGGKFFAHSEIVTRIIEGGSWIEDDWIRQLWAGLLTSACTADGLDKTNLPFADLLAKLTPLHLRILTFVCGQAVDAIGAGQSPSELRLDFASEELMDAADSHSFARIQQTIGQLSTYGLLAETSRPSYVSITDKMKTRITPTALGLKMHERCLGKRS